MEIRFRAEGIEAEALKAAAKRDRMPLSRWARQRLQATAPLSSEALVRLQRSADELELHPNTLIISVL